ncbi:MAG: hypothetical protein JSU04_02820 [Bdellovibrionales bacterium]|nr:hypothetical protein [Bdellovibrionales bacterium]
MIGFILSLLVWLLTIGLDRLFGFGASLASFGLGASLFVCYLVNLNSNLPQFLRTICPSISKAWQEHALRVSSLVILNMGFYLLIRNDSFSQQPILDPFENILYSKLGFFWLFLCVFLGLFMTRNPRIALEPLTKKVLAKRFGFLLLVYVVLIVIAVLFAFSPLVAMVATALALCILWKSDYFAKTSLAPRLQNKILAGAMIGVILAGLVSYKIAIETVNTTFLGQLASRKPDWKKAEEIKTVDEWARWYTSTDTSKTIDQTISSYMQLERLCQVKHSDNVAELVCDGEADNSFAINDHWKNEDILKLLASESLLANKIGLLQARTLAPASEDLKILITKVAAKSPALSVLAENTLSLILPQSNPRQLQVTIRKKNVLSTINEK